ncbi:MAG TPA: Uma2 family endonuclease [Blastocatellia bacterium]|nr:Uma2 family endonuclease [Blastocatellia bacterium]HMV85337.1 Uma2 family endonuclease [Blastocatellia bacterium]HMX27995.1 Uma2 family endonuclease [Blastocatellia bacterium]HMY74030.1 Uma2 family endonuclease [Blastocatellia bacterium]HMZ20095.1 Uma2 family endonuclease [Blastocatellia bacterium]
MSTAVATKTRQNGFQIFLPEDIEECVITPHRDFSDDEFWQFCARHRELRIEMTSEGRMIVMLPVGGEGSSRNFNLTTEFGIWVKQDKTGVGFDSSGGFRLPNKAKRSPDAAWVKLERWQALNEQDRRKLVPLCPDFVVELRSYTDRLKKLQEKMEEYIENGAQLGWLIDPKEKKVHIYRPGVPVEILDNPTEVSGEPLLKGFTLRLAGILD